MHVWGKCPLLFCFTACFEVVTPCVESTGVILAQIVNHANLAKLWKSSSLFGGFFFFFFADKKSYINYLTSDLKTNHPVQFWCVYKISISYFINAYSNDIIKQKINTIFLSPWWWSRRKTDTRICWSLRSPSSSQLNSVALIFVILCSW